MARKKADQPKNTTKIRNLAAESALQLAAEGPWEFVSPYEIATNAGLTVEELESVFPTKSDIIRMICDDLDAQVEEAFPDIDGDISVRDRLFDILMERLELANQDRAAHISFMKAFGWSKQESCADIRILRASMTRMGRLAGMDLSGPLGQLRLMGLMAFYGWVLWAWSGDDSPDLAKTMAVLDKSLARLDMAMDYIRKPA